MDSKDIWFDTSEANSEEPETAETAAIQYHATKILPIEELNKRERSTEGIEEEYEWEEGEERLFGNNIRAVIRAFRP